MWRKIIDLGLSEKSWARKINNGKGRSKDNDLRKELDNLKAKLKSLLVVVYFPFDLYFSLYLLCKGTK